MAEYPSGHKGADLKSAVLALIQLVGSNPTSVVYAGMVETQTRKI